MVVKNWLAQLLTKLDFSYTISAAQQLIDFGSGYFMTSTLTIISIREWTGGAETIGFLLWQPQISIVLRLIMVINLLLLFNIVHSILLLICGLGVSSFKTIDRLDHLLFAIW